MIKLEHHFFELSKIGERPPAASGDDIVKLFYDDHTTRTSLTETRRFLELRSSNISVDSY